jgi:hypothetical protein
MLDRASRAVAHADAAEGRGTLLASVPVAWEAVSRAPTSMTGNTSAWTTVPD